MEARHIQYWLVILRSRGEEFLWKSLSPVFECWLRAHGWAPLRSFILVQRKNIQCFQVYKDCRAKIILLLKEWKFHNLHKLPYTKSKWENSSLCTPYWTKNIIFKMLFGIDCHCLYIQKYIFLHYCMESVINIILLPMYFVTLMGLLYSDSNSFWWCFIKFQVLNVK